MRVVSSLYNLQPLGIEPLTGEADALSFRILCDLTAAGRKAFLECLGLPPDTQLSRNWNSGGDGEATKHVASVMLTNDLVIPLGLIGLLQQGYHTVLLTEKGTSKTRTLFGLGEHEHFRRATYQEVTDPATGYFNYETTRPPQINLSEDQAEDKWQDWPTCYGEIQRVFYTPAEERRLLAAAGFGSGALPRTEGFRNVHAMTGRAS